MKRTLTLLISSMFIIGCSERRESKVGINVGDNPININFQVIKMDGCEYVYYGMGTNYGLFTHKGNCNNPIHKVKTDTVYIKK